MDALSRQSERFRQVAIALASQRAIDAADDGFGQFVRRFGWMFGRVDGGRRGGRGHGRCRTRVRRGNVARFDCLDRAQRSGNRGEPPRDGVLVRRRRQLGRLLRGEPSDLAPPAGGIEIGHGMDIRAESHRKPARRRPTDAFIAIVERHQQRRGDRAARQRRAEPQGSHASHRGVRIADGPFQNVALVSAARGQNHRPTPDKGRVVIERARQAVVGAKAKGCLQGAQPEVDVGRGEVRGKQRQHRDRSSLGHGLDQDLADLGVLLRVEGGGQGGQGRARVHRLEALGGAQARGGVWRGELLEREGEERLFGTRGKAGGLAQCLDVALANADAPLVGQCLGQIVRRAKRRGEIVERGRRTADRITGARGGRRGQDPFPRRLSDGGQGELDRRFGKGVGLLFPPILLLRMLLYILHEQP